MSSAKSKATANRLARAVAAEAKAAVDMDLGPPDWRGLRGHNEVLANWQSLLVRKALPQVLLVEGRDGIGKRSLMAALIAMQACVHQSACGVCRSCQWLLSGKHPDVFWWEAEGGKLLIEDAERLQEHMSFKSDSGGKRFAVVVDADQWTQQAANRLLKTLEEPPEDTFIVLSCSRIGAMLETVLSRCVIWRIKPPSLADGLAVLREQWSSRQQTQVEDALFMQALHRCGRSPGKALAQMLQSDGQVAEGREFVRSLFSSAATADPVSLDRRLGQAETWARQSGMSLSVLLQECEIEWNEIYRQQLSAVIAGSSSSGLLYSVRQRRQILRSAKSLVWRAKTALNAQLTAEALVLSGVTP